MMRKTTYWLLLTAVALIVVACSSSSDATESPTPVTPPAPEPGTTERAIGFDAYLPRLVTRGAGADGTPTRSGNVGTLTLDGDPSLRAKGFGVLAYNTGIDYYTEASVPDYMYNQRVTWDGGKWVYEPVKYWPNGEGEVVGVTGATPHYVSFFAYAPWVNVNTRSGLVAEGAADDYSERTGITALTRNTKNGDPLVRYDVVFDPLRRVDLCWATPMLNQTKPASTDATVNMQFRHALTALNVQIDTDIRQVIGLGDQAGKMNPAHTRVWIRSVSVQGIAHRGMLNLNHAEQQPNWYSIDGYGSPSVLPVTVYDGRADHLEALHADLNELVTGLNVNLVQSEPYVVDATAGTITTPAADKGATVSTVNLFGDGKAPTALPVYAIPSGSALRVNIVYDVETYDAKLSSNYLADGRTPGSRIQNNITASVLMGGEPVIMQAGRLYTLKLHLGIAAVEATATVEDWQCGDVHDLQPDTENNSTDPDPGTETPIELAVTISGWLNGGYREAEVYNW